MLKTNSIIKQFHKTNTKTVDSMLRQLRCCLVECWYGITTLVCVLNGWGKNDLRNIESSLVAMFTLLVLQTHEKNHDLLVILQSHFRFKLK